jgi:endothelin-converting enzyme
MQDSANIILHRILESSFQPNSTSNSASSPESEAAEKDNFKKMKQIYDACMDEAHLAELGLSPLKQQLVEFKNQFKSPQLRTQSKDNLKAVHDRMATDKTTLGQQIGYLADRGINALIKVGIGADDRNPDVNAVEIFSATPIGLPAKEQYESEKIFSKYTELIEVMFSLILDESMIKSNQSGGKSNKQWAQNVAEFEKQLASIIPAPEDESDVTVSIVIHCF